MIFSYKKRILSYYRYIAQSDIKANQLEFSQALKKNRRDPNCCIYKKFI